MIGGSVAVLASAGLRGRRRVGVAATFAVLVLAAVGMAAGLEVSRQGAPVLDAAAAKVDVAHLVLKGDADAIRSAAADPEVRAWSGPFATIDQLELLIGNDVVPMEVVALDDPNIEVNRPLMQAGSWVAGADQIVLDRSLASDLGLGLGDTVRLRLGEATTPFEVVGTAVNFTDCFYPQCDPGRAWLSTAGMARLDAGDAVFAQGWLRFEDPAQADPFVERLAASGAEGIGGTESWLDTRQDFLTLDRVFGSFVSAFGVFVLVVAAVVVAGSMAMRIVTRRREIDLLGAVGCTPRQITLGLLVENLGVGAVAAVLGWFLGGFLTPALQLGIGRTLGPQDPSWSVVGLVVCLAAISTLLTAATVIPAVSAARRPVTDVLRNVPPDRVSWLNRRTGGLPGRLSLLGVREVVSQPTRGALAALAIAIAVVGALVSVGFIGAIDAVAADPARAGDPWDVAVIRGDLPADEVEGVLAATPGAARWFSEVSRRSTLDEGAFLSVATGGDPAAAAYQIAGGRSMSATGEGIAGYGFLERFGVSVGDEVQVLAGTTPITVEIVGWYRDTEDSGEILRYRLETLTTSEPGVIPDVYRVAAADGVAPAALGTTLGDRLGPSTRIEVLDTGVQDLSPLMTVLELIAVVLLVMAGTNLLSTLLISSRESAGRIGVQLAVGFTPRQIKAQGAVAGGALGVLAAVVGVPLGLWIFRAMSDAVSTGLGVGPGWMPAPSAIPSALLVVLAVLVSGGLGALAVARVARRPASDLVRGE